MGERHNCKVGKEVAIGDCLLIDADKKLHVWGFKVSLEEGGMNPLKHRVASVTTNNGSALSDYKVHDAEWYQLCRR